MWCNDSSCAWLTCPNVPQEQHGFLPQAAAPADGPCSKRLSQIKWRPNAPGKGNRLDVVAAHNTVPEARGLYDPANDRDACGVGFIAELDKVPTRSCVVNALEMLLRMTHRGACGCEVNSGAAPWLEAYTGISKDGFQGRGG